MDEGKMRQWIGYLAVGILLMFCVMLGLSAN